MYRYLDRPVAGLAPVHGTLHDLRQAQLLANVLPSLPSGIDHAYEVPEGDEEELAAFDGQCAFGGLCHRG